MRGLYSIFNCLLIGVIPRNFCFRSSHVRLLWCTFLTFYVSCRGRLFLNIYQCLCIINIHLLYKYWYKCLNFKDLRVRLIEQNNTLALLVNCLVLELSLGSNIFLQIPGSINLIRTTLFKHDSSYLMLLLFGNVNLLSLLLYPKLSPKLHLSRFGTEDLEDSDCVSYIH